MKNLIAFIVFLILATAVVGQVDADCKLIPFEKKGRYGYQNEKGRTVISPKFEIASDFVEGLAMVKSRGGYGYINCRGEFSIPPKFEKAEPFSKGLARVVVKGRYGFIDTSGAYIANPEYEMAYGFSEELSAVKKMDRWGYINAFGEVVIPLQYTDADPFSDGLARVEKDEKEGYVNTKGKLFLGAWFKDVGLFHEGIVKMTLDNKQKLVIRDRGEYVAYYDREGHLIGDTIFSDGLDFQDSKAKVAINGKTFFLHSDGKLTSRKADECDDALFYLYEGDGYKEVNGPAFPGGDMARIRFLQQNVRYPVEARTRGIQGVIYIQFIVSERGEIIRPRILRGVHPSLDEEALRVIRLMPDWEPRRIDGKAVCTLFNMPLKFTLQG